MGHMLPVLHDADDACLGGYNEKFLSMKMILPTSVICLRSSSIRSRVSFLSVLFSSFDDTVAIFSFVIAQEKSWLKEKESSGLISRPGGCFLRTLYFAQAKDCRCLFSSGSSIPVDSWISYKCMN